MLELKLTGHKWWQKPLVHYEDRFLPAELAILFMELRPGEDGAWLNSRATQSGVRDLLGSTKGGFKTNRIQLPEFVSEELKRLYANAKVQKGCPDLVIWDLSSQAIRLVEVKCPLWDQPSPEQTQFLMTAKSSGLSAKIVEWIPQASVAAP